MALPNTLLECFLSRVSGNEKDRTYLRHKPERGAPYASVTYVTFGEQVFRFAEALQGLGIQKGDRIAIVSESRPEWVTMDFAALLLGAVTVPMFPTLTAKQIEFILSDSEAKLVLVSNDLQLSKALKCIPECPKLEAIIIANSVFRQPEQAPTIPLFRFADLLSKVKAAPPRANTVYPDPDETITIIYTSGTTGDPKGVMLTHKNFLSNIEGALAALPPITHDDVFLSFLPLCHAFERIASYLVFALGVTVAYAESVDTVADNMLEIRPTIMTGVPRFYERIHGRLLRMREKMHILPASPLASIPARLKRSIFDWGLNIGKEMGKRFEGKTPSTAARVMFPLADKLVMHKIRERTGGRIRFFVSGAAALPAEVGRAFASFGLPIIEGYGMTECSPIISVSPSGKFKWGAVGYPLKNVEVKIAADGEILARGPNVMKGYYKHPEATQEMIDTEGWLHTGDIGEFDSEGYLKITDRKKHLLVSSGGKNIAPAPIESLLTSSQYIEQAMLLGDKRQYCTALIAVDKEAVQGMPEADIQALIHREIDRLLKDVASYERVRRFSLLPESCTVENGMLTPTLKIKRREVEKRYADLIEAMYQSQHATA